LYLTAISDRVKNFINRIQNSYPEINFHVEEKIIDDFQMSSSQAFNLYYVIQEAVNNALKHSKGRNIYIEITGGHQWLVIIRDDGTAFIPGNLTGTMGNGIQNMKNRCSESGWGITWSSPLEGGTMVKISPSTN